MSREIKFRAWSGIRMFYPDDTWTIVLEFNKISGWNIRPNNNDLHSEYICGNSQSKTPDFVLMQYTELKDKNGKEIYEGDILSFNYYVLFEEHRVVGVVEFRGLAYWIDFPNDCCAIQMENQRQSLREEQEAFEIIGNIYEHPDKVAKKEQSE